MPQELFSPAVGALWAAIGAAFAAIWIWLGVRLINRRERWTKWTAVALVLAPVLYVLSSGPLTMVSFRTQVAIAPTILPDGSTVVAATGATTFGKWFPIAYAPLFWASEQEWGDPVFWYWELFERNDDGP